MKIHAYAVNSTRALQRLHFGFLPFARNSGGTESYNPCIYEVYFFFFFFFFDFSSFIVDIKSLLFTLQHPHRTGPPSMEDT